MSEEDFLPSGQDHIRLGRLQNHETILFGLTYDAVGSIFEAMDCKWMTLSEDGYRYMKCEIAELRFTVSLLDFDDDIVEDDQTPGAGLRIMSAYQLELSNGAQLDVPEMINSWNTQTIKSRATWMGEGVYLDTFIPCDGVSSRYLTTAIYDWFESNEEFVEFIKESSTKDEDETSESEDDES